jgi:hypothetical protein
MRRAVLKNRAEGAINARRIMVLPAFIEISCENIVESFPVFSCFELCIRSTNYQCHLKITRPDSVGRMSSNSYRVSVATSILERLNIRSVTGSESQCYSNQLILLMLLRDWMPCLLFFLVRILGG